MEYNRRKKENRRKLFVLIVSNAHVYYISVQSINDILPDVFVSENPQNVIKREISIYDQICEENRQVLLQLKE